jgi:hypothetical protein
MVCRIVVVLGWLIEMIETKWHLFGTPASGAKRQKNLKKSEDLEKQLDRAFKGGS